MRLPARVVIILDLGQPLGRRIVDHAVEDDRDVGHVVEQRVETVVEQRQPMFEAGIAPALR